MATLSAQESRAVRLRLQTEDNLLARLDRLPVTRTIALTVILLVFAWIVESFDIGIIGTVTAILRRLWTLSPSQVGLLGTSSTVGVVIGLAVAGRLADIFGRRKVVIAGVAFFSFFTLFGALVPRLDWVVTMRFIAGLGEGAVFPIPYLMIAEIINPKRRGAAAGVMGALLIASYVLPSFVGAWAVEAFSPVWAWRVMFFLGGLPLVYLLALVFFLPESPRWLLKQGRCDEVRTMVERLEDEARVPHDMELQRSSPIGIEPTEATHYAWTAIFQRPFLTRSLVSWGVYAGALLMFYAPLVYGPTILVEKGLRLGSALVFTGALMTTAGFGSLLQGFVADRFGRKTIILTYSLLAATGYVVLSFLNAPPVVIGGTFLIAFFGLGIFPMLKLYIAEQYPTGLRGTGTGLGEATARTLGGVLAPFYIPFILKAGGVSAVFLFVAVLAVVFLAPMMLFGRETARLSVEEAGN